MARLRFCQDADVTAIGDSGTRGGGEVSPPGSRGSLEPHRHIPQSEDQDGAASPSSQSLAATDDQPDVEVIEEGVLPQRLRRPLDLVRLIVSLLLSVLVLLIAWLAEGTSSGLEEDITEASQQLPSLVVLVVNVFAGLGLLTLPVAVAVDLLARRRARQLLDALLALFIGVVLLTGLSILAETYAPVSLYFALSGGSLDRAPLLPLYGGLVAFLTVAGVTSRPRWNTVAVLVVGSLFVVTVITGDTSWGGIALSLLLGWASGLATRYALGTPTTRPSGQEVAAALQRSGVCVTVLCAQSSTDLGRRYKASCGEGPALDVIVLDRDLEGAGLAASVWGRLRFRSAGAENTVNMRRTLEQRAMMAYAAKVAGVPTPELVAASEVGPDSTFLAYAELSGRTFEDLEPEEISDEDLHNAFGVLDRLQRAHLAHRRLTADAILRDDDGRVWLRNLNTGTIAAGDIASRIDIAQMLTSLGLRVGAERALRAGKEVMGIDRLFRGLAALQPVALNATTRRRLKSNKDLLPHLRDGLTELSPETQVTQIQLERVRPRTIIMLVLVTVAGYVLLSQLAAVDLIGLLGEASLEWLALAALASVITYPGAAWALSGFVPEKLRLIPTIGAAMAADFATLVSPPTLSTVAINVRYLQRNGIHPTLATASIGVSQVAALMVHVLMLLSFGVAAGTQADFTFAPPRSAVLLGVGILVGLLATLSLPKVRNWLWGRWGGYIKQIGPRLVTLVQQPRKLVLGVSGLVLLNLGYIFCLVACVHAFGGSLSVGAIGVVYLTGSIIGQAAPTPGGLGAVEAALAAGLTAAGLASGLAVSAVLLFRILTFWLPTIPGWFALNGLQKRGLL